MDTRWAEVAAAGAGVHGLSHVGLTVADIDTALHFLTRDLGLILEVPTTQWAHGESLERGVGVSGAVMRLAVVKIPLSGERIEILEYKHPPSPVQRPLLPNDLGAMHVALRVNDIFAWVNKLGKSGIEAHSEPNLCSSGYFGGFYWTYFKDPLGNTFELVGPEHGDAGRKPIVEGLFHIGVTVSDLSVALHSFIDVFGCTLDYAPSQMCEGDLLEKGVGVPGAKLRLAVLRFGRKEQKIELLQYSSPLSRVNRPVLPNAIGAMHIAYEVNMDRALDCLRRKKVLICADPPNPIPDGFFQGWYWTYIRDWLGITHEILGPIPDFYGRSTEGS